MMRTPLVLVPRYRLPRYQQVPQYRYLRYRGTVVPTVHGTCWYQLASLYLPYGTVDIGQAGISWYVFIQVAKWY